MGVLKRWNGTSWDVIGGGSSLVTVDDPSLWGSALASATDYEFDANNVSTLPSGWSWTNQGSATYLERFGAGVINLPATTANFDVKVIDRSLPSETTWTATAKLAVSGVNGAGFCAGMALRDSTSGKFYILGRDEAGKIILQLWNSATSFNATPTNVTTSGFGQSSPLFVRVRRNSATSYDFEASSDGRGWIPINTGLNPSATLTINRIGFAAVTWNGSKAALSVEWLRVR